MSLGIVWGVKVVGAVNDKRDRVEVKKLGQVTFQLDLAGSEGESCRECWVHTPMIQQL